MYFTVIILKNIDMKLKEFVEKKYPNQLVDYKKVVKEYNKNEKDRKRYFAMKGKWDTNSLEFSLLKKEIVW